MMHQISETAGKRAATTTSVLESTGILPLERVNVAGCMDFGLVDGTTALLQASLTMSCAENVLVSQQLSVSLLYPFLSLSNCYCLSLLFACLSRLILRFLSVVNDSFLSVLFVSRL